MDLATQCAPYVAPQTMAAVVTVESSHNPYGIGVVGGSLKRQPANLAEAVATAKALEGQGRNFSLGMAQVNRHNLARFNATYETIFEPCTNVRIGAQILAECYARATPLNPHPQQALQAALSCYYSGNFTRGFVADKGQQISYVQKVLMAANAPAPVTVRVPAIEPGAVVAAPARRRVRAAQPDFDDSELLVRNGPEPSPIPADPVIDAPLTSPPQPLTPVPGQEAETLK